MRMLLSVAMSALLLDPLAFGAAAASTDRDSKSERSLDIPQQRAATSRQAAVEAVLDDASVATVTPEQVGDADSFGRKVKYLGVVMTGGVVLQPDCTGFDSSFGDRCIPLVPGVNRFDEADLGRIDLPAKATHSLVCFDLTPVTTVQFENPTASPRTRQLRSTATIVVENPLLNDPTIIDPVTGLPFGGKFIFPLTTGFEMSTIAAGATDFKSTVGPTRSCIGGLLSKQSLMSMGLTEKQANQFFKKPITMRLGVRGTAESVSSLNLSFGVRFYGD